MGPITIGIGGSGSGVGKTTLACRLLERLNKDAARKYGAIKYTPSDIYSSVVDDPEILRQEGKDTRRLLDAGAEAVLWVKSSPEDLKETLDMAVYRLSGLDGIIVEGNGAIEVLRPDIVIFITGNREIKESADKVQGMADVVIGESGSIEGCMGHILKLIWKKS